MIFKASLDIQTKITTAIVILILAVVLAFSITNIVATVIISLLSVGIIAICYAYKPSAYIITPTNIVIQRLIGNVTLPFTDIQQLSQQSKSLSWNTIRLFGVGGVFGYFGKFWNSQQGNMTLYATRTHNLIIIQTTHNKIVITPNQPEQFLQYLQQKLNHP